MLHASSVRWVLAAATRGAATAMRSENPTHKTINRVCRPLPDIAGVELPRDRDSTPTSTLGTLRSGYCR